MNGPLLDPLAEWSSLLMSSLADAGLTDLVVSPGSRSTPFVMAAARESRLRLHDVIDERSAAFFALGRARATQRPTGLLCTSGSAPAHWFPAVLEASRAHLPLVLLTADRPPELQECCAAQTVDQGHLFGAHVRLFLDAGLPDPTPIALRAVPRVAAQIVHASLSPDPGPVHLNLRARKPLEPHLAVSLADCDFASAARRLSDRRAPLAVSGGATPSAADLRPVVALLGRARRGLIVAGPLAPGAVSPEAILALSERTGFPVLCDATSNLRQVGSDFALAASDLFLGAPALATAGIDCLLQIGSSPVSAAWDGLCSAPSLTGHVVLSPHGWDDQANTATHLVFGPLASTVELLAHQLPLPLLHRTSLAAALRSLDVAVQQEQARLLEDGSLSEASATRALIHSLPEGSALAVGNSLAIRHVEAWGGLVSKTIGIYAQRGLNGIDGLLAGAAGIASTGRPTAVLLGDVSAVHDLGSLLVARSSPAPLLIVVLNNGGGRIFEQLPLAHAGLSQDQWRHFTTPHELDFESAARAFGVGYACPASVVDLGSALAKGFSRTGSTLVEARVSPSEAVALRAALQHRVDALAHDALRDLV